MSKISLFAGLWIPAHLMSDNNLNKREMLIFRFVESHVQSGNDVYVSNAHLAKHLGCDERTIKRSLAKLIEDNYLKRIFKNGQRYLLPGIAGQPPNNGIFKEDETVTPEDKGVTTLSPLGDNLVTPKGQPCHPYIKDNNKDNNKGSPTELKTENNEQFPKEKELPQPSKTDDLKQHTESKAYSDEKAQQIFKDKFGTRKVTYDEMFKLCQDFWHPKQRVVTVNAWEKWLEEEFDYKYEYKDSEQPNIPNHQRKGYYRNQPETQRFVPPVNKTQETLQEVVKNRETAHSSKLGGLYRKLKEKTNCPYRHMGEFIEAYKNGRLTENEKQILMQV